MTEPRQQLQTDLGVAADGRFAPRPPPPSTRPRSHPAYPERRRSRAMNSFHRQRASHRRSRRLVPVAGGQSSPSRSRRFTSLVAACASSGKATVPRVVGLPIDRAVNTVSQEGFPVSASPRTRRRPRATPSRSHRLRGRALQTRPWSWLSRPVSPDVVRKKAGDAVEALSGAGFVVADTTVSSNEPNGQVVSKIPAGGQSEARAQPSPSTSRRGPER
jgi:PASTA domain